MKKIEYEFGEKISGDPRSKLRYLFDTVKKNNKRRAFFICDCGKVTESNIYYVKKALTVSCGCHSRENAAKRQMKHGYSYHDMYHTYRGMVSRCCNPKDKAYKYYGEKGVRVCDSWLGDNGFFNFLEDMGQRPENKTLDRKDAKGNYCKENCRWVDWSNQLYNRDVSKTNKSGTVGVSWQERVGKWRAAISRNGNNLVLGLFENKEEAVNARKQAEIDIYGYAVNYTDEEV